MLGILLDLLLKIHFGYLETLALFRRPLRTLSVWTLAYLFERIVLHLLLDLSQVSLLQVDVAESVLVVGSSALNWVEILWVMNIARIARASLMRGVGIFA